MNDDRKREWELPILIGLTLVALATRAYGIWEWSFRNDEYYVVMRAAERCRSLVNPAYYALVLGSLNLFGVTEWSARLPTMLLGTLSVPVFYVTWRSVLGRNAAFIGALLIIFSSWHLMHSQYSRFYTGVFLFGSLSYFFYYKAIRLGSHGYLVYAVLANLAGILFHATSVMVPASCALFSIFVMLSRQAAESGYSRRIAATHLAICAAAGVIAASIFWQLAQSWIRHDQAWGYGPAGLVLQIMRYVQVPIAVSALFGTIFLLQRDFVKGVFFAVGIGVPVMALLIGSVLIPPTIPRYMFYAMPLVFAVAAFLCDQVRLSLLNYRFASHALTIIVIVCLLPEMVSQYTGRKSLDLRDAVEFVENAYQPGDRILVSEVVHRYYFGNEYPIEGPIGSPHSSRIAWTQKLQPYKDGKQRVWMILSAYRRPLAKEVEAWLMNNASLVWRKFEKRYDYMIRGIEIFLVNGSGVDFSRASSESEHLDISARQPDQ